MNWHNVFRYENGQLWWKYSKGGRVISKPSGHKRPDGYIGICIDYKGYLAHRIIYEMHYGKIPDSTFIDHIDRDKSNNKIENLRLATKQENGRNNSANGFCWIKREDSFTSYIHVDGKKKHLGYYNNALDARAAYMRARRKFFGEFA